jgi:hypothetical protein
MRFFEFAGDNSLDKFVTTLRNQVGRYSSKNSPGIINWSAISSIAKSSGFEVLANPKTGYEIFKMLWDRDPQAKSLLEPMVKNFNDRGLELKIPGAPDSEKEPTQGQKDSEQAVADIAAAAAPKQLAQSNQTPPAPAQT